MHFLRTLLYYTSYIPQCQQHAFAVDVAQKTTSR